MVLALAVVGCGRDAEDNCKVMCEFNKRCDTSRTWDCSESNDDMKECVRELESVGDDCGDAFGGFAECMNDAKSCGGESAASSCLEEAQEVLAECPIE